MKSIKPGRHQRQENRQRFRQEVNNQISKVMLCSLHELLIDNGLELELGLMRMRRLRKVLRFYPTKKRIAVENQRLNEKYRLLTLLRQSISFLDADPSVTPKPAEAAETPAVEKPAEEPKDA